MNSSNTWSSTFFGIGVFAINLVDDDDGLGAGFEGLAQNEAGLRLRAFRGVHHEQHAVDHVHDALDFAAEIRVAGGVHDIDVEILVFESGVFGADGDAFLAFQVHGIHEPFSLGFGLVGAERAGLLQKAIDERCLAVVHVRDDGDITNMLHIQKDTTNRAGYSAMWRKKIKKRFDGGLHRRHQENYSPSLEARTASDFA